MIKTKGQPRTDTGASERGSAFGACVLMAALSLHSVLEGLAVGVEREGREAWVLVAAVCCHKGVAAVL